MLLVILSTFFLSLLATLSAAQATAGCGCNLTVYDPWNLSDLEDYLIVGEDAFISWYGGEAPYSIMIVGEYVDVNVASGQQWSFYSWTVDLEPGNGYQFEIRDRDGHSARSNAFEVVAASSVSSTGDGWSSTTDTGRAYPTSSHGTETHIPSSTASRAATSSSLRPNGSSSSLRVPSAAASLAPEGTLTTGTKIGIAIGAVGGTVLFAALVGLWFWRRRQTRGHSSSFVADDADNDPSPAVDPFPYQSSSTPDPRPMSITSNSLSTTQPSLVAHPGLVQQYSAESRVAYLHPAPETVGQPGRYAGPPPAPSPTTSTPFFAGGASTSSAPTDSVSIGATETAGATQGQGDTKARPNQSSAADPRQQQQPLVIQETDSGAVIESERLPPSYNQAWSRG